MSIEDRLRSAMNSGPEMAPSEQAWKRITDRAALRRTSRYRRWMLLLIPTLGAGGAGLGLSGVLSPAAHPSRVAVVPAPGGGSDGSGWGQQWSVGSSTTWLHGDRPNYLAFGPATTLTCSPGGRPDCYVVVQSNGMEPTVGGGSAPPAPSALYRSTDAGSTWTRAPLPPRTWLSSPLACTAAAECVVGAVVGGEPGGTPGESGHAEVLSTDDGGRQWTAHRLPTTVGLVPALACPSPGHCVALVWGRQGTEVDGMGPESGSDRFFATSVLTTTDGGRTWRTSRLPAVTGPTHYQLLSLVCPTGSNCVALGERVRMVDENGGYVLTDDTHLVLSSTDAGRSWRATETSTATAYNGIACGTASSCMVVGQTPGAPSSPAVPSILVSATAGRSWVVIPEPVGLPDGFGSPPGSVSCPSASRCVALDGGGEMATTSDGGRAWNEVTHLPTAAPGYSQSYTSAVSCTASGPCLALQDLFPAPQGVGRLTASRVLIDSAPG